MAYQALYRKYRPTNFDEVVGQTHIIQTLKNAICSKSVLLMLIYSVVLEEQEKLQSAKIFAKNIKLYE